LREGSIRGLRAFCAAARHLSFRAAAEELCVTPSAVSHQIKALEERLHAALFERRTHELVLTQLGTALRAQLEPLLCELDNVTARFEQRAGRRRVLRIGVMPFFASELLIPRLGPFVERHRAIDVRVDTAAAGAAHATGCDASILLSPEPPVEVVAFPLLKLRLTPACSPQLAKERYLTGPRALLGTTLIVHNGRPHAWQDWFAQLGIGIEMPPKLLQLDTMFAVARAAERGLGVALLPLAHIQNWLVSGALVRPCARELETTDRYYFVYRRDVAGNPDVIALRDWVTAAFTPDERLSQASISP
jgi:LysR family glycine cleavage system transcriptional activator